ncbi:MAG: F0F1 ATP synthase subunit B [Pseudomonadota bacterium]
MNINATLIGQTITFFVFLWICYKYIWPVLTEAMRERQKNIAEGLAAAERAEKNLAQAKDQVEAELAKAKEEAAGILDQARQRAAAMVEEAKNEARTEGERLKEAAQAEIAQEVNRAKESLRAQVATLSIAGAEQVLGASVDASAHGALLDKLAAEL